MEQLNEKIEGLVKKAEKSGMPYSILKKVYDRGMAAWKTGHRPGTTPQQWAFARVNSFVTKSSGTWGKADKDLADKVRGAKKESIENPKKAKDLIGQVREKLGKDADAGDYIKDFRKSDAPQFKGKSDKKIRDMAIAAYLDDKDKKESIQEQKVFVFRYEYKGKRYAAPFKSEKDAKSSMKAAMKDKNVKNPSITQDILKRGVKFAEDVEIVEFIDEAVLAGRDYKYNGIGPIKISKKMYAKVQRDSKGKDFSGKPYMLALNPKTQETEMVPVKFEEVDITEEEKKCPRCGTINKVPFDKCSNCGLPHDEFATYKAEEVDLDEDIKGYKPHVGPRDTLSYHLPKQKKSMKAFFDLVSKHPKVKNVKQETLRGRGGTVSKIDYDTDKNTQAALMRELDKLEKKFGEYAGQTNVVEEVDNSLMAQATRVISHTSIREKIDPADIDIRATDADRKAADKNIIIQLRRAQDMVKQTGRQDQTGIEFLDRKKQKVDSKIINKALDMFDKMKPNDKAKMQKTIGKSYRDLLKTVQRGRV